MTNMRLLAGNANPELAKEIAEHLGMQLEEVFRLKQITGVAELFKKQLYSNAWEMKDMENNIYYDEKLWHDKTLINLYLFYCSSLAWYQLYL